MMKSAETLRREIEWVFDCFGDGTIGVVLDDEKNLKASIGFYVFVDSPTIEDVEYFTLYCNGAEYSTSSFDELINALTNIEELIKEHRTEEDALREYYNERIRKHSVDEIRFANEVAYKVLTIFLTKTAIYKSYIDFLNAELEEVLKEYVTREHTLQDLVGAFELGEDWSTYSDWYKSLNGCRPRLF